MQRGSFTRGVVVLLGLGLSADLSLAAGLADGLYTCMIANMTLGDIEIMGGSYRGPAYDGDWGDSYALEVTDGGTVNWGGPLGGITEAGRVVSTVLTDAGNGRAGFDITIQNESGNFQTISCFPR